MAALFRLIESIGLAVALTLIVIFAIVLGGHLLTTLKDARAKALSLILVALVTVLALYWGLSFLFPLLFGR